MSQLVQVVDENDRPVGAADMAEVYAKGLLHRTVRVMVEDGQGRVLLQKRSRRLPTFPGCWDHSAAGFVDEGETYDDAAARELTEELGISGPRLTEAAYFRTDNTFKNKRLNRFNKLYRTVVPAHQQLKLDDDEVSEVRWFTIGEVKALIRGFPSQVTDGLILVFARYY